MARGVQSAASIKRGETGRNHASQRAKIAQKASLTRQMRILEDAVHQLPVKNQAVVLSIKAGLLGAAKDAADYLGKVVRGAEQVDKTADRIRACSIVLDAAGILQQSQQSATDSKEINELSRAELVELARDGLRMLAGAAQADRVTVEGELVEPDE